MHIVLRNRLNRIEDPLHVGQPAIALEDLRTRPRGRAPGIPAHHANKRPPPPGEKRHMKRRARAHPMGVNGSPDAAGKTKKGPYG